ncbi:unnamed protein product [Trifolium pratense]|uniref:Uncharacterized protein n=1 Tax=Trifolium pratense TaxID=57577 RepID=A0ACB0IN46_TRIPR|nr:unnamed protein product [Trifolium pratense]
MSLLEGAKSGSLVLWLDAQLLRKLLILKISRLIEISWFASMKIQIRGVHYGADIMLILLLYKIQFI